jgi:hypothetical protein
LIADAAQAKWVGCEAFQTELRDFTLGGDILVLVEPFLWRGANYRCKSNEAIVIHILDTAKTLRELKQWEGRVCWWGDKGAVNIIGEGHSLLNQDAIDHRITEFIGV